MSEREFNPTPLQESYLRSNYDVAALCGERGIGKTTALLATCIPHIDNHEFSAVVFTTSSVNIDYPGGLCTKAESLYAPLGGRLVRGEWCFPSGAKILLRSLCDERQVRFYDGMAIPILCFDNIEFIEPPLVYKVINQCSRVCGDLAPRIRLTGSNEWGVDQWPGFQSFMAPRTSQIYVGQMKDNPHLPSDYVARLTSLQTEHASTRKPLRIDAEGRTVMDMRTKIALDVLPSVVINPPEFIPQSGYIKDGMRHASIAAEAFKIADAFIAKANESK